MTHLVYNQAVDGQLGQLRNFPGLREETHLLQPLQRLPALPLQSGGGIILQETRRQRDGRI